jgi:hypothetical protein
MMHKNQTDHKKVWGSGFHAGLKSSGNCAIKGTSRRWLNATNAMLCWDVGTANIKLVFWPDTERRSDGFDCTTLACYKHIREKTFEERKTVVFVEAMHLIIRDGCNPQAVHNALIHLEEYRDGCSGDMPGL